MVDVEAFHLAIKFGEAEHSYAGFGAPICQASRHELLGEYDGRDCGNIRARTVLGGERPGGAPVIAVAVLGSDVEPDESEIPFIGKYFDEKFGEHIVWNHYTYGD